MLKTYFFGGSPGNEMKKLGAESVKIQMWCLTFIFYSKSVVRHSQSY